MLYTSQLSIILAVKQFMHYVNCIYIDSETNDFMIFIMCTSPTQHITQYIRKSIKIIYSVSKYTFNLWKPVEIYKVHHYEIVLVSHSWIKISYSATHKYKPVNDETYE